MKVKAQNRYILKKFTHTSPATYGFILSGDPKDFFIIRLDTGGGYNDLQYYKGDHTRDFDTDWGNRGSLTYDYPVDQIDAEFHIPILGTRIITSP